MTKVNIECDECQASYQLRFDMDESRYIPEYCPFCGDTIDLEDNSDFEGE